MTETFRVTIELSGTERDLERRVQRLLGAALSSGNRSHPAASGWLSKNQLVDEVRGNIVDHACLQ